MLRIESLLPASSSSGGDVRDAEIDSLALGERALPEGADEAFRQHHTYLSLIADQVWLR
jgi:hypothetical protein